MFSFIFGEDDKKKAPKPEGDAAPAKGNKGGAPGGNNKQNKRSSGDDRDSRGSNKGSGNSTPTVTFQIGDHVRTQNLEKLPHFDGKLAVILTPLDAEGKHKVQIRPKGQNLKLYPTRLRAVSEKEYLQENPEGDKPIQNLIDQARQSFGVAAAPTGANANNVARDNNSTSTSGAANKDNKQGNAANNARGSAGTVQNAAPPAGEAQDNTTRQGSVQSPEPAPKTSSTGATTSAAANANAASGTRSSDSVQQVQQQQMAAARKADTQYSIAEVYENATPAQADQQTRFSSTPAVSLSTATGTKQPQKSVAVVEPQKSSTPQLSQSGTTSGNSANSPAAGTTSTSVRVSGRASTSASLSPEEVEKFNRRRSAFFDARHGDAIAEQERAKAEFVQKLVEESDLRVDAFLKSYALEQKMMQKKAGAVGAVVGVVPERDSTINGRGAVPAPSSLKGKGKKA